VNATPGSSAGWHPDPVGRHELRYFDGAQWTGSVSDAGLTATDPLSVAPPGTTTAVAAKPPRALLPYGSARFVWGIVSVLLLVVGSLGTWATVGPLNINGTTDGHDGIITLILAGIAAIFIIARRGRWGVLVAGILATATTVYDLADLNSDKYSDLNIGFSVSPGWGLILAVAASISLCLWPFFARP
jgi:Protein of unknown function (DUF2510)